MEPDRHKIIIPEGIAEIWQRVIDSLAIYLAVPGVMINRLQPPELEVFMANSGSGTPLHSGTKMDMDGVYCTTVALRRDKLKINDASSDPEWSMSPTAKEGIISYMGVPLIWPDGEVFGTLCAIDVHKHDWGEQAESLLQTLKDTIESHLALILENNGAEFNIEELEDALEKVLTLHGFTLVSSDDIIK